MLQEHMPSHLVLVLWLDQQCFFAVALAPEIPPHQVQSEGCDALNLPPLKPLHVLSSIARLMYKAGKH